MTPSDYISTSRLLLDEVLAHTSDDLAEIFAERKIPEEFQLEFRTIIKYALRRTAEVLPDTVSIWLDYCHDRKPFLSESSCPDERVYKCWACGQYHGMGADKWAELKALRRARKDRPTRKLSD